MMATVLLSTLAWAEEPTPVDFKCAEKFVPADRATKEFEAYLRACIQGWVPKHIAAKAEMLKPSGKPSLTAYASMGDGGMCGPDEANEGGEVLTSFIVLVPVTGDEFLSKLPLKVETTLTFCHEEGGKTRLNGTVSRAAIIR